MSNGFESGMLAGLMNGNCNGFGRDMGCDVLNSASFFHIYDSGVI